jgi:D-alanyl-lipoteichoic acid acyltransferase DltB (MBOAT superfamily)
VRWRDTWPKGVLCGLGLALLYAVSHGPAAPLTLAACTLFSHGLGSRLRRSPRTGLHTAVQRGAVPLAFALLVLLNLTGLVGTLTGAQSTLAAGASLALIALPFYLLSMAAFLSEMAGQRQTLPTLLDYAVYVGLPFKLLAGPLEPPRLLKQIERWRFSLRRSRLRVAWPWLALGLFMKYVVANRLDPAPHLQLTDPLASLVTAAVFELKFYFDFAGYSFMAYGGALALGLHINRNFDQPFLAPNVVLFWRRWHMSLGRFLARYLLEPNLSLWRGRQAKLVFASSIFLASAMWHGGTVNYLLWGLFHGTVYFVYGQWVRRWNVPAGLGTLAMLMFFVGGRMLAVEANGTRLLERLAALANPWAWRASPPGGWDAFFTSQDLRGIAVAAAFLAAEVLDRRLYPHRRGYHLLRRPAVACLLCLLFVLFGIDSGTLLYARV